MNNSNSHSNNGFMGGLILGVLVGAALVFLLATKKGKKLLKILAEEGAEGISELEELLAENVFAEKPRPVKSKKVSSPVIATSSARSEADRGEARGKQSQEDDLPAGKAGIAASPAERGPRNDISEAVQNGVSSVPAAISRFGARRRFFKGIPKRN